jgi:zinc protease
MEKASTSVTEMESGGMRFFATRTGAKDVVTISGSIFGGYSMLPRAQSELPALAAELLDAGTNTKSKHVIRESLSAKGISISFSSDVDRLHFFANCFPEDVSFTLKTIVDCLSGANFPLAEIKVAKERAIGELKEEKTDTQYLAVTELSRMMYDPSHINYAESISVRQKSIEGITRAELLQFRKMLGKGGLVLAMVGDIQPESALETARKIFSTLPAGTNEAPSKSRNKKIIHPREAIITVANKANIDVCLGTPLSITYDDPAFIPLTILLNMLGGGGFSSHLMVALRERDSLTYAVHATLTGFTGLADGNVRIAASFSPQKYTESVEILRKEISVFFNSQITDEKLSSKKIEIAGDYLVGLSTTRGLARKLHSIGVEGKPLTYLDEYLDLVNAVTVEDLKAAARLIPLDKFSLAAAGTFVTEKKPVKSSVKKPIKAAVKK